MYNEDRVEFLTSLYFIIERGIIMEEERKIRKIGNSLGLLLPSDMLKRLGLENGDTVHVSLENGEIIIRNEDKKEANDKFKEKVLAIIEEYMESMNNK
jgi:putative addiction module antidote